MHFDKTWLGDDFKSDDRLHAEFGPTGELLSFGFASETRTLLVDVARRRACDTKTTIEDFPEEEADEVSFASWMEGWRDGMSLAARPAETEWRCAFCGKSRQEVRKLIAGPSVFICDECVDLCHEILEEGRSSSQG